MFLFLEMKPRNESMGRKTKERKNNLKWNHIIFVFFSLVSSKLLLLSDWCCCFCLLLTVCLCFTFFDFLCVLCRWCFCFLKWKRENETKERTILSLVSFQASSCDSYQRRIACKLQDRSFSCLLSWTFKLHSWNQKPSGWTQKPSNTLKIASNELLIEHQTSKYIAHSIKLAPGWTQNRQIHRKYKQSCIS